MTLKQKISLDNIVKKIKFSNKIYKKQFLKLLNK